MRNFGQKHRKICRAKSGFQILYAVEQFSSLLPKDKLEQGAHIHPVHRRCFIFLFVIFEHIGERERGRARSARKKNKDVDIFG